MGRPLSKDELARYARHISLPEFGLAAQEKLKDSSVLLVGLGGLGSPAAMYLAAAGVGKIGLLDPDVVEASNLQRQVIHSLGRLGEQKVASAAARLRDLNPDVEIECLPESLTSENAERIIQDYDLVLDGTDNFPTRYLVNDACVKLGKPNVFAGVMRFEGQVCVFDARKGPCYRCAFPEPPPPELAPNCAEAGVLGVLPGIIGTLQANEAIKLLAGVGETNYGSMYLFDGLSLSLDKIELFKNPECKACAKPDKIVLKDLAASCLLKAPGSLTVQSLRDALGIENLCLIDVREDDEVCHGMLPGALHVEQGAFPEALDSDEALLKAMHAAEKVVLICRSGQRSGKVRSLISDAGWPEEKLFNLVGGLTAWKREVDPRFKLD